MVPPLRATTTQTRRGNRSGYVEHDDFEGLPVRQWRQEWVNIVPPPPPDTTQKNDIWDLELPHGMPKDANLLPSHTQDLLRAARSGRLYKRPPPTEEEEGDADAALPEKPEKKEEDSSTKGFQVKVWKQIPRNAEGPTVSHLAKRRKGTVTLASHFPDGTAAVHSITKATVRRVDADGNAHLQEITLQEGQAVDGEIISTTVVPVNNSAPSVETSVAATPVRRRPPPPKRKAKGPGRGRRKKLPLPLHAQPKVTAPVVNSNANEPKPEDVRIAEIKQEGGNDETKTQDSEMADDDDGDEGEDDGDDGDEGDEGDDDDGDARDGENSENRQAPIAESEAVKPDHPMDATLATGQPGLPVSDASSAGIPTIETSTIPKRPSPLSNTALPPDQVTLLPPHPQTSEGSPPKSFTETQSPSAPSPQPVSTSTEAAPLPPVSEVAEATAPAASVEPIAEQATIAEAQPAADVEMTDFTNDIVADEPTQTDVETAELLQDPVPTGDTQGDIQDLNQLSVPNDTSLMQLTELTNEGNGDGSQLNDLVTQPANGAEAEAVEQGATTDLSTAPVESVADPVPAPVPSVEPNATNPSLDLASQPIEDIGSVEPEYEPEYEPPAPVPAPASIDTQLPPPESRQAAEDPEPESPDLFSGLEAALNQQGDEPKESLPNDVSATPVANEVASAPAPTAEAPSQPEGQQAEEQSKDV
ncbi:hypothetical protein SLS62_007647 [Diatrype stigma]|uniref:Apopolysialoglycoprotein n=1 Tax=Diatrype stigma TaxID=117547 RepID=A0AAN9UNL1_9PEZI